MIERKRCEREIDPAQYRPRRAGAERAPEMERSMGLASRVLGAVVVIGAAGALIAAATLAPRVLRSARPMLRRGLKRGLGAYAALRAAAAEFTEDVEDLVAEVQSELSQARPATTAHNDDTPPTGRAEAS
jgi:hypothetical protein